MTGTSKEVQEQTYKGKWRIDFNPNRRNYTLDSLGRKRIAWHFSVCVCYLYHKVNREDCSQNS